MTQANRQSWDETWLAVADIIAARSLCSRARVGAVIVDAHNRIVATGYNGPPAGMSVPREHLEGQLFEEKPLGDPLPCDRWCFRGQHGPSFVSARSYIDCPALHAELNALSVCDRSVRDGGTIYITGDVCFSCAKAIANSGLARVVAVDTGDALRAAHESYKLLTDSGLDVVTT